MSALTAPATCDREARTSRSRNWPASAKTEPWVPNWPERRVTMWIMPPVAPSPYSTLLPPRVISMRSTVSIGIVDSTELVSSFTFRRTPSTMITMFCAPLVPKPRRSSAKSGEESRLWRPNTPPILRIAWLTSLTPASRISSWVMTVAPIGCSASLLGKREPVMTTVAGAASSAWAAKGMEKAMAQASASGFIEIIDYSVFDR